MASRMEKDDGSKKIFHGSDNMDLESAMSRIIPLHSNVLETGTCGVDVWLWILVLTHYICLVAVVQ